MLLGSGAGQRRLTGIGALLARDRTVFEVKGYVPVVLVVRVERERLRSWPMVIGGVVRTEAARHGDLQARTSLRRTIKVFNGPTTDVLAARVGLHAQVVVGAARIAVTGIGAITPRAHGRGLADL